MSLLLPALLLSCADIDPGVFEGIEVEEAWLEEARLTSLALVVGRVRGSAELFVEGVDGELVSGPVALRGGTAGFMLDVVLTEFPLGDVPLQLPREEVMGEELLGRYRGRSASLVSGLGVETHHLRNDAGVEIDQAFLALGVGMMLGYESLTLRPVGADSGDTGDTGFEPDTGETR